VSAFYESDVQVHAIAEDQAKLSATKVQFDAFNN